MTDEVLTSIIGTLTENIIKLNARVNALDGYLRTRFPDAARDLECRLSAAGGIDKLGEVKGSIQKQLIPVKKP